MTRTREERRLLSRLDTFRGELVGHFEQRPLMNKTRAAEWLGVTRDTLDKAIERGQITTVSLAESEWIAFADLQRLARIVSED